MFNRMKSKVKGKDSAAASNEGVWTESKDCHMCGEGFGVTTRKHHCRKCGNAICGDCSKNKMKLTRHASDQVRVCDQCFQDKDLKATATSDTKIYPPAWVDMTGVKDCFKCKREPNKLKREQLHNCRTCGRVVCTPCTTKIEVPPAFQGPKKKTGPARVCLICVMMLDTGVEMCETPPPAEEGRVSEKPAMAVATAEEDEDIPVPVAAAPAAPVSPSMANSEMLRVQWENGPMSEDGGEEAIAQIPCMGNTSLQRLHQMIKRACPDLANMDPSEYHYLCAGDKISTAHYHVFEARHLLPMLWVRQKKEEVVRDRRASVQNAANEAILAAKRRAAKAQEEAKEKKKNKRAGKYVPVTKRDFAAAKSTIKVDDMQKKLEKKSAPKAAGMPPGMEKKAEVRELFKKKGSGGKKGPDTTKMSIEEKFKARTQLFGGVEPTGGPSRVIQDTDDLDFGPPPPGYAY